MAQSTAFQTYDAIGNHEDLSDVVTNISPMDTLFLSRFGKEKATNTYHEWTTDSLANAADNAHIEGADYTFAKRAAKTRVGSYVQNFETPVEVTDDQIAANPAGADNEFAYQLAKAMKEHARDIEVALVSGTGNSGASGTARRLKGVMAWMTTNVNTGTGTGNETLTETMFNDTLQNIWNAGGSPASAFAGGTQKRAISAFTAGSTKFTNVTDKELTAGVDVYDSDFGRIKVYLHRWMTSGKIAILTEDLWKIAQYRNTRKTDVAKVGSATRAVVETGLTLVSRQEAGSGQITQLS
jgi:hypothetical protein